MSAGSSVRHRAAAAGQRSANLQPAGSSVNAGTGGQAADGGPAAALLVLTGLAGAALVVGGSRRLATAHAKR